MVAVGSSNEFELLSEAEVVTALQNLLIALATGQGAENSDYRLLRDRLVKNPKLAPLVPTCVRTCRDLSQFWSFIKREFGTYAERRQYLWSEMEALHAHLDGRAKKPADESISERLKSFDANGVHAVWAKALERRNTDPDGAITAARTLLETICKHILDAQEVGYDQKADLPVLYRLASESLKLAPSQYTEDTFKEISGWRDQRGQRARIPAQSSWRRPRAGEGASQAGCPPRRACGQLGRVDRGVSCGNLQRSSGFRGAMKN